MYSRVIRAHLLDECARKESTKNSYYARAYLYIYMRKTNAREWKISGGGGLPVDSTSVARGGKWLCRDKVVRNKGERGGGNRRKKGAAAGEDEKWSARGGLSSRNVKRVCVCTCESGYRFSFFFGGGGRRADEKRAAQPRCIIKMLDCFLIRRLAAFSCFSVPRYNVYRYLAEAKNAVIILASNTQTHARIHVERKIHTCRSWFSRRDKRVEVTHSRRRRRRRS